jgi:formamidase
MGATATVRFKVHKDLAKRRTFAGPVFSHGGYFADPQNAVPKNFLGVMGMPINAKGEIESENLTLAARNAILNMMTLLQERGFSREQACVMQRCRRSSRIQCGRCAELRRVCPLVRANFWR